MRINTQMNRRVSILIFVLLCSMSHVNAQQIWSFDGKEPLVSTDGTTHLKLHSIRTFPELTTGIIGKGFRTAGYTGWLTGKINQNSTSFGISGWFALESFPTDTAAFFGVKDTVSQKSISLVVDRFGKLMIEEGKGDKYSYISTNHSINRFNWIHTALSFHQGTLHLYVDGENVPVSMASVAIPTQFNHLIIAKDFRDKKIGIQDVPIINGIVDEIRLWNQPIQKNILEKDISGRLSEVPVLAVPKSRFKNDFNRPKYHLLPDANWTNETHGLIYYKGEYHIFNQKNASSLLLRQINWGHFSSPDLINWTEHKPALTPEPGYDQNGIWSGCVVLNDQGIPTIIYTAGGDKMGIGIAFAEDSTLIHWKKYAGNPVIPGSPKGFTRTDLRDPYVWKEGDTWYMIVGFGIRKNGEEKGTVLLYRSSDLKKWKFLHTLYEGNPKLDNSGIFWEMPVFRKMGQKYVLLINKVPHNGIPARAMYWVGDFKNEKFIPYNPMPKNLEVINRLLSPSVALDKQGRLTAIAIIPDEIGAKAAYRHGWTHLYSIPRVWQLKDGKIIQTPHPALKQLRGAHQSIQNTLIGPSHPLLISENHQQVEASITILPNSSKKYGFLIRKNPDNSEYTRLYYDSDKQDIVIDQTHASQAKYIPLRIKKDHYYLDPTKPVNFHLFIDGSVVEVFINQQDALTTRIFTSKESSNQLEIFSEDGNIDAHGDVWKLHSAKISADF